MSIAAIIFVLALLGAYSYFIKRQKVYALYKKQSTNTNTIKHTLPKYFGYVAALWSLVPALLVLLVIQIIDEPLIKKSLAGYIQTENIVIGDTDTDFDSNFDLYLNEIKNLAAQDATSLDPGKAKVFAQYQQLQKISSNATWIIVLSLAILMTVFGLRAIKIDTPARVYFEKFIEIILLLAASIAILTTVGIVLSVLFESLRFFGEVPFMDFMFGLEWSPQTAIRADQVGSSSAFGAVPLFVGTMLISVVALFIAVPLGLMSAIFLSEYASPRFRSISKPVLEILAGIPTVVYGFFAALTVAPFIRNVGESLGLSVASESALAAGLVMGIMIIPFVSSLSDDVLSAVPNSMREGSLGLGATQSETITKVLIPAALPGIVGGILLAASRAIGETMIVVMAAGLAANLTANPLQAVTTVTVQIVTLLTGDQEFDSAKTLAAFALGLMLFVTTLVLNVIALHVVRKYREEYE
ncbi:MAG: phosphate ABC transporter permease subunit PstC [Marinicellaceae bacterium]